MNAPDYLSLLRQEHQPKTLQAGTAQTAKTTLRSLCSSSPARKNPIFSAGEEITVPAGLPQLSRALPTSATDHMAFSENPTLAGPQDHYLGSPVARGRNPY